MKARNNVIYMLVMLFSLCFGVSEIKAQDVMRITGRVLQIDQIYKDTIYQYAYYGLFLDVNRAKEVKAQLDNLKYKCITVEEFRDTCRSLGIRYQTKPNGIFKTVALPNMVLLAVNPYGDTVIDVIREGKTDYTMIIKIFRMAMAGNEKRKEII